LRQKETLGFVCATYGNASGAPKTEKHPDRAGWLRRHKMFDRKFQMSGIVKRISVMTAGQLLAKFVPYEQVFPETVTVTVTLVSGHEIPDCTYREAYGLFNEDLLIVHLISEELMDAFTTMATMDQDVEASRMGIQALLASAGKMQGTDSARISCGAVYDEIHHVYARGCLWIGLSVRLVSLDVLGRYSCT